MGLFFSTLVLQEFLPRGTPNINHDGHGLILGIHNLNWYRHGVLPLL
jgi:hypothetical protein